MKIEGDEWMRSYEWIDRSNNRMSLWDRRNYLDTIAGFTVFFFMDFDEPCNVDLFRCRDCYGNNLHKPSMELPGSQSRNYLETTNGTTKKVPTELPGNHVDKPGVF